jgi:hypothetical protein
MTPAANLRPVGENHSLWVPGWQSQLQSMPDFTQWLSLGTPVNGHNAPESLQFAATPDAPREFYRWEIKRP